MLKVPAVNWCWRMQSVFLISWRAGDARAWIHPWRLMKNKKKSSFVWAIDSSQVATIIAWLIAVCQSSNGLIFYIFFGGNWMLLFSRHIIAINCIWLTLTFRRFQNSTQQNWQFLCWCSSIFAYRFSCIWKERHPFDRSNNRPTIPRLLGTKKKFNEETRVRTKPVRHWNKWRRSFMPSNRRGLITGGS